MTSTAPNQQQLEQAEAHATASAQAAHDARLAHSRAVAAADAERDRQTLQAARNRVADYDRMAAPQEERAAHRAFARALADDPLVQAWVEWQAAKLWVIRKAGIHNVDRTVAGLAELEVQSMPLDPPDFPTILKGAAAAEVYARLATLEAEYSVDVEATMNGSLPLTRAELAERGARDDERRRREAATTLPQNRSVDVTGMSEAKRAELGLPPAGSR